MNFANNMRRCLDKNASSFRSRMLQSSPPTGSTAHQIPSLLAFENDDPQNESCRFIPRRQISIPGTNEGDTSEYHLSAIIYYGGYHFTARIIDGRDSWAYDSQRNDGEVTRESRDLDEEDLKALDGRGAHILLYAPRPAPDGKQLLKPFLKRLIRAERPDPE
jgi:hypothetical protein